MNSRERTRFHNLLKLAAESPFAGERQSALAAADRLAARHHMTLDEAAAMPAADAPSRGTGSQPRQTRPEDDIAGQARRWAREFGQSAHLHDSFTAGDKERRARAMRAAYARGLDASMQRRRNRPARVVRGSRRMNPKRFATVLLEETRLPFKEIAALTGLSVHAVVALKLQLRPTASSR